MGAPLVVLAAGWGEGARPTGAVPMKLAAGWGEGARPMEAPPEVPAAGWVPPVMSDGLSDAVRCVQRAPQQLADEAAAAA